MLAAADVQWLLAATSSPMLICWLIRPNIWFWNICSAGAGSNVFSSRGHCVEYVAGSFDHNGDMVAYYQAKHRIFNGADAQ